MKDRITLRAGKGKVLTNGSIYVKQIHLAVGADESEFYEITESEYRKIVEESEKQYEQLL